MVRWQSGNWHRGKHWGNSRFLWQQNRFVFYFSLACIEIPWFLLKASVCLVHGSINFKTNRKDWNLFECFDSYVFYMHYCRYISKPLVSNAQSVLLTRFPPDYRVMRKLLWDASKEQYDTDPTTWNSIWKPTKNMPSALQNNTLQQTYTLHTQSLKGDKCEFFSLFFPPIFGKHSVCCSLELIQFIADLFGCV